MKKVVLSIVFLLCAVSSFAHPCGYYYPGGYYYGSPGVRLAAGITGIVANTVGLVRDIVAPTPVCYGGYQVVTPTTYVAPQQVVVTPSTYVTPTTYVVPSSTTYVTTPAYVYPPPPIYTRPYYYGRRGWYAPPPPRCYRRW